MKPIILTLDNATYAILAALTTEGAQLAIAAGLLVAVGVMLVVRGKRGGGR